jgi:hypothetical protein
VAANLRDTEKLSTIKVRCYSCRGAYVNIPVVAAHKSMSGLFFPLRFRNCRHRIASSINFDWQVLETPRVHYKGIVPLKTKTQELIDLNHFCEPDEFSNFSSFPFFHQAKGWKDTPII